MNSAQIPSLAIFLCLIAGLIFSTSTPGRADEPSTPAAESPTADEVMTRDRQKELFEALDLSGNGLEPVRKAVAQGDYGTAEHAWADYLRQRTSIPWSFDYLHPQRKPGYTNLVADDAANGKVTGGYIPLTSTFPDGNIDWFHNETFTHPPLNFEWQWQICRMMFWNEMGAAYRATGDERYPKAWAKQLCSFVQECPVPGDWGNYPQSAWRTIDSGIRMGINWPSAFFSFLHSPSVTDADLAVYTVSCLDHGRFLRKYQTSGNWVSMEMNGLYTDGCIFPEFKEAKDWRLFAADKLGEQEAVVFLPDGAEYELSTGYQNVTLDSMSQLALTAKLMGRLDELPAGYIAALEKPYAFDLDLMAPDRTLPRFNDSWNVSVPVEIRRAAKFFPDNAEFQWAATNGKTGQPPTTTSHYFPWAGFAAMRSGWGTDANYDAFRLGSVGFGHCQQDKLDFLVWAYGTEVLFSSGGGSYEASKWRSYGVSSYSHNCVTVDGKSQNRQITDREANIPKAPIDARWQSSPEYDFACGTYADGYGTVTDRIATQVRRVLFVKPDLFIVADTLSPNDSSSHTYEARWQLLPTQTRLDPTFHEVTTTAPGKPNLAVVPLSTQGLEVKDVSAQTKPELLGWNVRKDELPENVPATTVVHTKTGPGVQQFLTLFIPIKPGDPDPVKSVESKGEISALVTMADGRTLAISADADPVGNLEMTETLPGGAPGRHVKSQ